MTELQGLQLRMGELGARGLTMAGVSVDPVAVNADLARTAGLEFLLLSDPELRAIDAYGLRHRDGHDGRDIALSASVLIDGQGIVRWVSRTRNVRVRPTPDDVLAALDRLA